MTPQIKTFASPVIEIAENHVNYWLLTTKHRIISIRVTSNNDLYIFSVVYEVRETKPEDIVEIKVVISYETLNNFIEVTEDNESLIDDLLEEAMSEEFSDIVVNSESYDYTRFIGWDAAGNVANPEVINVSKRVKKVLNKIDWNQIKGE